MIENQKSNMLTIEKLLISLYFHLCILIVVAFIGWLLVVKLYTPSDKFWRISNFAGLLLTCLGIFGIVKDSRQIFYEREYYKCQMRIESVYKWRLISNLNEEFYCREFIETEYSPSDLTTMQEDYNATCQWIKANKEYFWKCYFRQKPIIVDSIIYPRLQVSDQILKQYFKDIQQYITDYNDDIAKLREYEYGQQPNTFELLYIIFSPFFLAIGLGWEFVKFFAKR